jgi:hypothetical protein
VKKEFAMKKKILLKKIAIKRTDLVFLFFFLMLGLFVSCTDGDTIERDVVTTKSIGLRTTLNKIKGDHGIDGRVTTSCFSFVYPLNLSYNNSTVIMVNSDEGLLSLLENEHNSLYIDGISFPFQIVSVGDGTTMTVSNEADFQNIVDACDFPTFNDYITDGTCYDFIYPFAVKNHNNQSVTITSTTMLNDMIVTNNGNFILDMVYPFAVAKNGQNIPVEDAYQFFEINDDCNVGCNCDPIDAPVCVQTSTGVLQFQNECIANCAGFYTADFVDCN